MFRRKTSLLVLVLVVVPGIAVLFGTQTASAQEFRIYTKIYDQSQPNPVVADRTLALFHAGKVYDHIDSAGEVVIFEPMQHRFTILSTKRALMTEIHFDEINRLLKLARGVVNGRIGKLRANRSPVAEMLQFQMEPRFDVKFDKNQNMLSLRSPYLQYDVTLKKVETREIAEAYRQYADWMNRLNFVLHPNRLLPDVRLELNRQLRERQALPVDVVLRVHQNKPLHLRAEHKIHWKLINYDRTRISGWKAMLADPMTQKLTFREYQKSKRR